MTKPFDFNNSPNKDFWNYNINPITGLPPVSDKVKPVLDNNHTAEYGPTQNYI